MPPGGRPDGKEFSGRQLRQRQRRRFPHRRGRAPEREHCPNPAQRVRARPEPSTRPTCARRRSLTGQSLRVRAGSRARQDLCLPPPRRPGDFDSSRSAVRDDASRVGAEALRFSSKRKVRVQRQRDEIVGDGVRLRQKRGTTDQPANDFESAAGLLRHGQFGGGRGDAAGKFLYASNRGHDSIAIYKIDSKNGTLTTVDRVLTQGKTPRNSKIDPTGPYLLAANQDSGSIVVFRRNGDDGRLTPTGQSVAVGSPVCIQF